MKDIDDTKNLKDKQIAVRVPYEIFKWFGGWAKKEGKTQQDLVIDWLLKLRQDHDRGNPSASLIQYMDNADYHITPQLMENMENHINHYRLTSKERLLAEAKMHFQLFIWSSAYYALAEKGKKREGYAFGSLYSAQQESGISFVSEGEALRGGL